MQGPRSPGPAPASERRCAESLLLDDAGEPAALEQNVLGHLGAQVGVRRLLVHEHAANLAELAVDRGDLELDAWYHLEALEWLHVVAYG